MSAAMYEITNEKSDFEKGYLDLELHMVNAKDLKVIDASMLVMPEDTIEDGFITNCCKVVAFACCIFLCCIDYCIYRIGNIWI